MSSPGEGFDETGTSPSTTTGLAFHELLDKTHSKPRKTAQHRSASQPSVSSVAKSRQQKLRHKNKEHTQRRTQKRLTEAATLTDPKNAERATPKASERKPGAAANDVSAVEARKVNPWGLVEQASTACKQTSKKSATSYGDFTLDVDDDDDSSEDGESLTTSYSAKGVLNDSISSVHELPNDVAEDVSYIDELRLKATALCTAVENLTKLFNEHVKEQPAELVQCFGDANRLAESLVRTCQSDEAAHGFQRNWTAEFHSALKRGQESFSELVEDFEHTALLYSKIIVSERQIPPRYKTIRPVQIGGALGGQKYIHHGLLFKFSDQEERLKAPSHELKGLSTLATEFAKTNIFTPLFTVVQYKGFCISAQTIVPINSETLIYGSADGGITVRADDSIHQLLENTVGAKYGLSSHKVVTSNPDLLALSDGASSSEQVAFSSALASTKTICGPIDLEVHKGKDGKLYAIDAHRLSVPSCKRDFLFSLFRYEFLERYHKKHPSVFLSNDAFSSFASRETAEKEDRSVRNAIRYLREVAVPEFCGTNLNPPRFSSLKDLCLAMHGSGINVRFLGFMQKCCIVGSPGYQLVHLELCARCVKRHLVSELRKISRPFTSLSAHVRRCVELLNELLSFKVTSDLWLAAHGIATAAFEVDALDMQTLLAMRHQLTERVCELSGIELTAAASKALRDKQTRQFVSADVRDLPAIVKKVEWNFGAK